VPYACVESRIDPNEYAATLKVSKQLVKERSSGIDSFWPLKARR
jgi:hypothetical protein